MLAELNEQQRAAVLELSGVSMIIAGAGSGKTKTLIQKIQYLITEQRIPARKILAVTFTNKAAEEMRERMQKLLPENEPSPQIKTLHALGAQFLREYREWFDWPENFVIYNQNQQFNILRKILEGWPGTHNYSVKDVLKEISQAKQKLQLPRDLETDSELSKIYEIYQNRLLDNRALDFDDLVLMTYLLWQSEAEVLVDCQNKFEYILTDEFQDLNQAQYELIRLLAQKHQKLCVVGDPDQSIYAFRGAYPQIFGRLIADFPSLKTIKLEQNYRCSKTILEASQQVIQQNSDRPAKKLWTENARGEIIDWYQFQNEYHEAEWVVTEISRQVGGVDFRQFDQGKLLSESKDRQVKFAEIAIIYRTHSVGRIMAEQLARAGIPYQQIGEEEWPRQKIINYLTAYLKVVFNPEDNESLLEIINFPVRQVGRQTVEKLVALSEQKKKSVWELLNDLDVLPLPANKKGSLSGFVRSLKSWQRELKIISLSALIKKIVQDLKIEELSSLSNKDQAQIALFQMMSVQWNNENGERSLPKFLEQLATWSGQDQYLAEADKVTLLTAHAAKGLEFETVFMAGLNDGIWPQVRSGEDLNLPEERRLFYVGMTRAQKKLFLLSAQTRTFWGQEQKMVPTRFITEIGAEFIKKQVAEGGFRKRKLKKGQAEGQMALF